MELMRNSNKGFTLPEVLIVCLLSMLIVGVILASYTVALRSFKIVQVNNILKHKNSIAMEYIIRAIKQATYIYSSGKSIEITPGSYYTYTPGNDRLVISEKDDSSYTYYVFELEDGGDNTDFETNKIKRLKYTKRDSDGNILTGYTNESMEIGDCIAYSGTTLDDGKISDNIFTASGNDTVELALVFTKRIARGNKPREQSYIEQKSRVVIRNE